MKEKFIYTLLLLLIAADLCYSFVQHAHATLDGDLAAIVLPAPWYAQVLNDPLGLSASIGKQLYGGTNRFFSHYFLSVYMKEAPLLLKKISAPVDNIYHACALIKTIMQAGLIFMIAACITAKLNPLRKDMIIAMALITPMFQAAGPYAQSMGIINESITYAFFYSLPSLLLLIFLYPLFSSVHHQEKSSFNATGFVIAILLAFIVSLGGPLNPPLIFLAALLLLLSSLWQTWKKNDSISYTVLLTSIKERTPIWYLAIYALAIALCIYSMYLGSFNVENQETGVKLSERYFRLKMGMYYMLTDKLGLPLLILFTMLNGLLIGKGKSEERKKILNSYLWIGIFAFIYTLLLPLGGYRSYRYYVIRSDTAQPLLICLVFLFGLSTYYLIKTLKGRAGMIYKGIVVALLLLYTIADEPRLNRNACEKDAIREIAASEEELVNLDNDCTVMAWTKMTNPYYSGYNADLLQYWGILKNKKTYIQK